MATDWGRLTVVDLRHELKQRGLPTTGKKADLVERLTVAESQKPPDTEDATDASPAVEQTRKTQDAPAEAPATDFNVTAPHQSSLDERPEDKREGKPEEVERPETINNSPAPSHPAGDSTRDDADADEPLNAPTKSEVPEPMDTTAIETSNADDSAGTKDENGVPSPAVAELSPELSKDARGRKRRSRTPPPSDDESSRKRVRRSEQYGTDEIHNANDAALAGEEVLPLDDEPAGNDSSYANILPDIPTQNRADENTMAEDFDTTHPPDGGDRSPQPDPDVFMEDTGDVEPSIHPATSALYIKNFMRPLRPEIVRNYLVDLATPPGRTPDPETIQEFFLDPIRTHAFVQFESVAAASRVRVRLHSIVWPEESNRKALWVDFVPPERILEWIQQEEETRERGKSIRWELIYEEGHDGEVNLELVDMGDKNTQTTRTSQMSSSMPIPTGPRQFAGIQGAPTGPRGHGFHRDAQVGNSSGSDRGGGRAGLLWTTSGPPISYKPVPDELAQRRFRNMRSHYTTDRDRHMGREDEINRYTFERDDLFVDRGVEVFVGIRRPPGVPPARFTGDRSYRPRDDYTERDVSRSNAPRSRFDGAPLPTFRGGRNSRRGRYWGHR